MSSLLLSLLAQDSNAEADTFHRFPRLPVELKRMIWGFAARDYKKGAHFVASARRSRTDLEESSGISYMHDAGESPGHGLIAPEAQDVPGLVRDWVVGNPSSYIQDSGLWMACFESREVMQQRYTELNNLIIEENEPVWYSKPFANSYFEYKKEQWPFKVCPAEDLLCIQPLDNTASWFMSYFELPDRIHSGSWNQFKNIALEYDPAWFGNLGHVNLLLYMEASVRGCFFRTLWTLAKGDGPIGLTFWLIDRTIRKNNNSRNIYIPSDDEDNKMKTEPTVFHGNGRRYVEVGDLSECESNAIDQNTAFHFLHFLQIDAGFSVQWMMDQRDSTDTSIPNGLGDLVKILREEEL